jgi:hypothetical protein
MDSVGVHREVQAVGMAVTSAGKPALEAGVTISVAQQSETL